MYSDQWISFDDWLLPDTTESSANVPEITESSEQPANEGVIAWGLPAIKPASQEKEEPEVLDLVSFP